MSDQLARTGTAAGAIVIGGTVITGWYLIAVAVLIVAVGALAVRYGFRAGRDAGDR